MKVLRVIVRSGIYALAFTLPIVALAALGFYSTLQLTQPKPTALASPATGVTARQTKSFDPTKPTVAIVLGSDRTESTDFLIPYALFSATGAYNVYAVAPARTMTTLDGGLEVLPDFSYAELEPLLGKSPDIVMIPAFPNVTSPSNQPVLAWIKHQAAQGSFLFSICVGAEVFAATGLLDGHTATTHWGDIDRIEQAYPAVHWVRGVRYVDGGDYMTSAGITSGMDAVLHYIAQHNGASVAQAVAQQLHYPSYAFVDQPQVPQESAGPGLMLVGLMNIIFHWQHPTAGVLLYDGVGELELAATFDTYAASYTTRLLSMVPTRQIITTRHGLQVVPRWGYADAPAMDRLIVPGSQARQLAASALQEWEGQGQAAPVVYLHAATPDQFAFDAPLADLARQENIPTAVLAAKRVEYRPGTVQTVGGGLAPGDDARPAAGRAGESGPHGGPQSALAAAVRKRDRRRKGAAWTGSVRSGRTQPVRGSVKHFSPAEGRCYDLIVRLPSAGLAGQQSAAGIPDVVQPRLRFLVAYCGRESRRAAHHEPCRIWLPTRNSQTPAWDNNAA